jgi:probable rRNA maturation factor
MEIELLNQTNSLLDVSSLIRLAEYALLESGIHPESELSITLVDEIEMASLNSKWMDQEGPTDVLSFPMDELRPNSADSGPGLVGDIVLCPSYAEKQAIAAGHSLQEELELLTVHGVLHLLGFDHRNGEEEKIMFGRQADYLKKWRNHK